MDDNTDTKPPQHFTLKKNACNEIPQLSQEVIRSLLLVGLPT